MEFDIDVGGVDFETASSMFDQSACADLRHHLYTKCILDSDGIERVMIQLRAIYIKSYRCTIIKGSLPNSEDSHQANALEALRSCVDAIAMPASKAVHAAQMEVMLAAAHMLSELDQKMNKRSLQ